LEFHSFPYERTSIPCAGLMDYQKSINTLPTNNLHKFDDLKDWLYTYSHHYPTDQEREEIYRLEDWISSYR
jgi:hypothetical protein